MSKLKTTLSIVILITAAALASEALGITRDQVMVRARSFAYHPWRSTAANKTASCSTAYSSSYIPGDYMGLPYDWGGYMTLFEFDQQIAKGYGAGSYPADGVLACTAGLDCSGYVSKCWAAGHFSTSTLDTTSSVIAKSALLPGDVMNKAGYHVSMYSHTTGSGTPVWFESAGYNVHINVSGGWSAVSGFTPRRYDKIQGTTAGNPKGTLQHPILISSFPYTDSRNTATSASDVLDGCAAAPTKNESGPEVVYRTTFTKPGSLTLSVTDDVSVDIDVHLYGAKNTSNCLARHDSSLTYQVDCGTYHIVADTFVSGGVDQSGLYTLKATFAPSAQACGSGPAGYTPRGKMGDACAFSGNKNLPFCNENLGAEICLTSTSSSFCSKSCSTTADCSVFSGGCCKDLGKGQKYCLLAKHCGASTDGGVAKPDGTVILTPDGGAASPDTSGPGADGAANKNDGGSTGADGSAGDQDGGSGGCRISAAGSSSPPRVGAALLLLLIAWRRLGRR